MPDRAGAADPGAPEAVANAGGVSPGGGLEDRLPAAGPDGRARAEAMAAAHTGPVGTTSLVAYRSGGALLVIEAGSGVPEALAGLPRSLGITVLVEPGTAATADRAPPGVQVLYGRALTLEGHLGAFRTSAQNADGETLDPAQALGRESFDLVLDLGEAPLLRAELPPPGYYAPGRDPAALAAALATLPEMVGEFEKPRYFSYDPDICAHGDSGLTGCTRCLEACPAEAIRSLGDEIDVDPHLCQGGGACATVCPSGAIRYAYPAPEGLLGQLRGLVVRYREAGGSAPWILFHDGETGRDWVAAHAAALPERVLPAEVEEVASVGLDAWLTLLAWGASGVALLRTSATPPRSIAALQAQVGFAGAILAGMGYPAGSVMMVDGRQTPDWPAGPDAALRPASFAAQASKRTTLRLALDHLHAQAPLAGDEIPLPAGAPFGTLTVDRERCTLCMACVGVCPAVALSAGDESPRLSFVEWNCVQCGLCEVACPEDAISLAPRLLRDPEAVLRSRVLNEDLPFRCVGCGKPFATRKVIERMRERLTGHWMFQKPEALQRLEMCEECRVKDLFRDGGGVLDP